jgi:hypothetical protein
MVRSIPQVGYKAHEECYKVFGPAAPRNASSPPRAEVSRFGKLADRPSHTTRPVLRIWKQFVASVYLASGGSMAKKTSSKGRAKTEKVMHEYKQGTLKSAGRKKVKSRKQAVAIALSEARKSGARIPKKQKSR